MGPEKPLDIEPDFDETYTVKVYWDNTASSSGDWIGIYSCSSHSNKAYLTYKKIEKADIGEENRRAVFTFDIPRKPGMYEFRYFFYSSTTGPLQGNYGFFCSGYSTEPLRVRRTDKVTAKREGQILIVSYCCPSVNPAERNTVAVYRSEAQDAKVVGSIECNKAEKDAGPNRGQVSIDLQKPEYRCASEEERAAWFIRYLDARGNTVASAPFPK